MGHQGTWEKRDDVHAGGTETGFNLMTQITEKVSQTAGLRSRRKTYLAAQMIPPVGNDAVSAPA